MYKKSYELLVGIFVLCGIITLVFMALKVSGLSLTELNKNVYRINAQFQNIGSLRSGAAVRIAGVEIGKVESISLKPSYSGFIANVILSINKQHNQIPSSYSASIDTSGILGESFISLQPSQLDLPDFYESKYLQNGSTIELSNTSSAINLNSLINTFISASGDKK
ncbi:outer membrane lipid asymmetry maintenance protein MlaD [Fastidiosibacter lacustris]|uniref:outer membrane lipid asymmetry maintenance protein MlaD n=1 Tax=Fastidiosibacter lacustris TaxID=2056695 RepID=UPI000E34A29D|nr:outer membrane lipid asymmetry maintenance protein MlaD [Fastidiosibacter lacustris]